MKKRRGKQFAIISVIMLLCGIFAGCGSQKDAGEAQQMEETGQGSETIRVGSLKGPTSMGLLSLMKKAKEGGTENSYEFHMAAGADELLPLMVKGELDIALIPANAAAILYEKTEGQIAVLDINTLGVLYMVTGDTSIRDISDLKGKTVYLTGKGTTPDYVLHYILAGNGMEEAEYTLEYKSEATEVAALLAKDPAAVGLLPQPFATAACAQNEKLKTVLDLNEEWKRLQGEGGSRLVTGVTVVRKQFLEKQEEAVKNFLKEHEESTKAINDEPEEGARLAVEAGIVAKEEIAVKAIPACNITCISGEEMKEALSGYLKVLYEASPDSVGGTLPEDDFYILFSE